MVPKRFILIVLAIIAVTGAVSVPNSLAVAWRLDVSDPHVVDRGGVAWDQLIHRVADINDPSSESWPQNENYGRYSNQLGELREDGASQSERSGYGMEDKSRSAGEERQVDTHLRGNYFRNDQYGGVPTTPSADPMIKELSREPSAR